MQSSREQVHFQSPFMSFLSFSRKESSRGLHKSTPPVLLTALRSPLAPALDLVVQLGVGPCGGAGD